MKKKIRLNLSTTQKIMLSFFAAILVGSILLALPISSASGEAVPYIDALFTATTSVCVTGLVTVPTVSTWSLFGHIVILFLIQIGGLGVITILSGFAVGFQKRMGIGDSILIQDSFNLNTLSGLREFVKKVILGTFLIEGIGALFYMLVFVPEFGLKGIWISVFHAISAFCSAGMDIISENGLYDYVHNPIINFVTMGLIIVSGIGYIVWWDVLRVLKNKKKWKWKCFQYLTLHSKIALSVTGILIIGGTILILLLEYQNPLTIGEFAFWQKIQASLFQSVMTRTGGFATIPQQNFGNAATMITLLLMFIGGSPVGMSGGVKTVTAAVLCMSALAAIQNKNEVTMFHRNISKQTISKSVAVVIMSFVIMFISMILLSVVTEASALDILFEAVSATATVGWTRNLTPYLNTTGKLIVIVTMYLGRIGPVSLVIAFNSRKEKQNIIKNPTEEISVG